MNNLRLIKIYELKGKVHPIEAAILDILYGIEEYTYSEYSIVYRKEDTWYFTYNKKINNILLLTPIYKLFKCSKEETRAIMKYLLEKHLKININEAY